MFVKNSEIASLKEEEVLIDNKSKNKGLCITILYFCIIEFIRVLSAVPYLYTLTQST